MIIKPGYCAARRLAEGDREELDDLMRRGRLLRRSLRRFGLTKRQARYHIKHLGWVARLVYYAELEWRRRRRSVARIRRYWWKPGQSGNPAGRVHGAGDNRNRRRPSGIAEVIRAERDAHARDYRLRVAAVCLSADNDGGSYYLGRDLVLKSDNV